MTTLRAIQISRTREHEIHLAIKDAEKRGWRQKGPIRSAYREVKSYHKEGAFIRCDGGGDINKYIVRMVEPVRKSERSEEIQSYIDSIVHCQKATEKEMEIWSDHQIKTAYYQLRSELDS